MERVLDILSIRTSEGMLALVEILLTVLVAVVLQLAARSRARRPAGPERAFGRFAANKPRAILLIFLLALLGRAAVLPIYPPGVPRVHDEFSYLLTANTLASGRLTNPTHPMWLNFKSMYVIHNPSYTGKYPPAQ